MALTIVNGGDPVASVLQSLALSTAYLGSGNYIEVRNATRFDLWVDGGTAKITFKMSLDGGSTFSGEFVAASAGAIIPIAIPKGRTMTLDVKVDTGTPNAGGCAYGAL